MTVNGTNEYIGHTKYLLFNQETFAASRDKHRERNMTNKIYINVDDYISIVEFKNIAGTL